jgi:hypothetical protein
MVLPKLKSVNLIIGYGCVARSVVESTVSLAGDAATVPVYTLYRQYRINHDVLTVIEGIHKERDVKQEVL